MSFEYSNIFGSGTVPSNRKERLMAVCQGRFSRLHVLKHKGFSVGFHQGYKGHQFGVRSGPALDIQGVVHDLAHVVEFGDNQFRRRTKYGGQLVFNVPRIWVYNRYCEEPTTGISS